MPSCDAAGSAASHAHCDAAACGQEVCGDWCTPLTPLIVMLVWGGACPVVGGDITCPVQPTDGIITVRAGLSDVLRKAVVEDLAPLC